MKPRTDVVALVTGLLALAVALLGWWASVGSVDWSLVAILAPVTLVVVGLIGLGASRTHP